MTTKLYVLEVDSCNNCPNIKTCKIAWEHTNGDTFPDDCSLRGSIRSSEELKAEIESVNHCLNPISLYSTDDLVRELCSREGVEYTELGKTTLMRGPAKIIVIRGDE